MREGKNMGIMTTFKKPTPERTETLGLTEALGVAGHRGIAPPVALLLEEVQDLQGVMAAPVPMPQEEVFVGVEDAMPASFVGALRKGWAPEIAKHGRLGAP